MKSIPDSAAITAFGALAQDTRLAIYRLLVEAGAAGLSAGAIAGALDVAAPTLSFHLAQLRGAGLITQTRASRSLIYAVDIDRMNALIGYLTDSCCGGNPDLCKPNATTKTSSRESSHVQSRRKAV